MDGENNGGGTAKGGGKVFAVMVVGGIVILILIVVLILVVVNRKVSVVDGTSSAYEFNDEGDNIVAMSVSCSKGNKRYSFYKDGLYEVYSEGKVIDVLERGKYSVDGVIVQLVPYSDGKNHDVKYISNQLVVDGETYECNKFEDVSE